MYCLWPLPHLLLVFTTLVCVLFVASTTSTISVYCLCPLPHLLLVCTTVVCVLFVATPTSTTSMSDNSVTTHKWSHLGVARHLGVAERGHIQFFYILAPFIYTSSRIYLYYPLIIEDQYIGLIGSFCMSRIG